MLDAVYQQMDAEEVTVNLLQPRAPRDQGGDGTLVGAAANVATDRLSVGQIVAWLNQMTNDADSPGIPSFQSRAPHFERVGQNQV